MPRADLTPHFYRTDDAYGDSLTAVYATIGPERMLAPTPGAPMEHNIPGFTAAMYNVAQNTITYGVLSASFLARFCRPLEEASVRKLCPELLRAVKQDAEKIYRSA